VPFRGSKYGKCQIFDKPNERDRIVGNVCNREP